MSNLNIIKNIFTTEILKNILIGIVIGVANIIPGVSGGTLAVVLGIYDRLMESIANFLQAPKEKKIEYLMFLVPIGIGAGIGILAFARVIEFLFEKYPLYTKIAFIILILPSIPLIVKGENHRDKKNIFFFILGFISIMIFTYFALKFSGNPQDAEQIRTVFTTSYYIKLVFCGFIAIGAMIIPGISGSFLLLILGEYENIVWYINHFKIVPMVYLAVGMGFGAIGFTKVINYCLKKHRSVTLFFILGIIIASLIQLFLNL